MKRFLAVLLLLSTGLFAIHPKSALAQTTSQCPSLESAVFPPDQSKQFIAQINEQLNSRGIAGETDIVLAIDSYGVANWWNPSTRTMLVSIVAVQVEADKIQSTALDAYAGDTTSQLIAMGYPSSVAKCLLQLLREYRL